MRILPFFIAALFFISPAMAAPAITQAGADALKPKLESNLKQIADSLKTRGFILQQTGDLTVEPADSYYAVTTPSLTVYMPNMVTRTIGMLAINAVPTDDPDILKIAMALPTPMIDTDVNKKIIGKTTIGQQAMTGVWNMAAGMFTQAAASYNNIQSTDIPEGSQTNLAALTFKMLLTEQPDKTFSGPSETLATGLTHTMGGKKYTVASAQVKSIVNGMDLATLIPAGHDTTVSINTIGIEKPQPDGTTSTTTIKSVILNSNGTGMRTATPTLAWDGALEGFTSSDAALAKLLPTSIRMKAQANGPAIAGFIEGTKTQTLLKKEGSTLTLKDFTIDAPGYGLSSSASARTTALGPQGQAKISIRGLAEMLAGAAPSIPPVFSGLLAVVQMTGKPETDAQGRSTLTYDFQMGADGKLTLNGADISGILGGGATPPAAPRSGLSAQAAPQ